MKRALAPGAFVSFFVLCAACGASAPRPLADLRVGPPALRAQTPAAAAVPGGADGAHDIGDPYFPGLGNGGYEVEHYDLVLDLDMASDELEGQATLRAHAAQELASFSLDLYGLEVESVLVDGVAARFERLSSGEKGRDGRAAKASKLVIRPAHPLASGSAFTTEVSYSGSPEVRPDPSVGFQPVTGWDRKESGVYVVSECIGASSWYPCNDHPRDKATYSLRVTVEKPYTVAGNGLLKNVLEEGDQRTFEFTARDPMASYLVTLNVAEFGVLEDVGPRGIPVRTYYPTHATPEELADFRRQPEVLAFLETVFGPYPFECAGAVLAYEDIGGALECQTIPIYSPGSDLEVIVHELAHQWYGDTVSPDLWRDIWLSEGFATYAEWLWREHVGGSEAYESAAREEYVRLRQRKTGSPFDPGVAKVFSSRVYKRGAMVLYGLRRALGDEAFFRILKGWVDAHRNGNASTADFVSFSAQTAGRDLAPFFDAWLYSEITPEMAAWEPQGPAPERAAGEPKKP